MNPLQNKTILLGVTGSIAAYKAADLASKLAQSGARVYAILTQAATHFIAPLTFQSVTGQRAYSDSDLWGSEAHVLHVGLAHKADLLVIAPASATTLARLAHGLADNLLSLTALAFFSDAEKTPLLLAPAMDAGMYGHPATQENVRLLEQRGCLFLGPEEGHLASGLVARGRMSEPAAISGRIRYLLSRRGPWQGKRVVVTAGGTQEVIDPVRYLSNRSSGKQGFALAQAALDAGADVTLISAPAALTPPDGARLVPVRSAAEMQAAVLAESCQADILLMAAAVADFRPATPRGHKIKKEDGDPALALERTADILAAVKAQKAAQREQPSNPKIVVGFAAETQDLLANAQAKLHAKGLDLIVANNVSASDAGFEVDTNRVLLLWADGQRAELPLMSKAEVAEKIVAALVNRFSAEEKF